MTVAERTAPELRADGAWLVRRFELTAPTRPEGLWMRALAGAEVAQVGPTRWSDGALTVEDSVIRNITYEGGSAFTVGTCFHALAGGTHPAGDVAVRRTVIDGCEDQGLSLYGVDAVVEQVVVDQLEHQEELVVKVDQAL